MTILTRFAPSPTGDLHVGNLRQAVHNWLFAQGAGGGMMLRIDDTDEARSEERFVENIRADLAWLGISVAGEVRQSQRFALYETAFARLVSAGRVYPCYETAEELDIRRKILLSRGLPPVYERTSLALSAAEQAAKQSAGVAPHWRFRLDHDAAISWHDLVRGDQHFDPKLLSDPVVRRADGSWLYMLPSVIDDIDMAITHVVRGEDHVSNTATQLQMFAALGADLPQFAHTALLTGAEGKLSKRLGSLGVAHFRGIGIEPQTLVAKLARLGTADPVEPMLDTAPLIAGFDFARFGRAPARFDEDELVQLNARIVHQLSFDAVAPRLPAGMTEAQWLAVRPNLARVSDAADWADLFAEGLAGPVAGEDDRPLLAAALLALDTLDWSGDPWHQLTSGLASATGRKGRALFLPLRRALTARDTGPDMTALLPLIGIDLARQRLLNAAG
jgi:glutamyl-tRNA synthetase